MRPEQHAIAGASFAFMPFRKCSRIFAEYFAGIGFSDVPTISDGH